MLRQEDDVPDDEDEFHLRGGRGIILDDPDHRTEVMQRGNALERVEDV